MLEKNARQSAGDTAATWRSKGKSWIPLNLSDRNKQDRMSIAISLVKDKSRDFYEKYRLPITISRVNDRVA